MRRQAATAGRNRMLRTSLNQVKPGMRVGTTVLHPQACGTVLLKPGAELTGPIIERLRKLGVSRLWVDHPLTRDLDEAVNPALLQARVDVYNRLKGDLHRLSRRSISNAQLNEYRRAVIALVRELVTRRQFAGLTDRLFDADCELVSHSSNVAYLATLVGLELEAYLVRQRPKLPERRAREVVNLGLGAMLHDLGKVQLDVTDRHEILEAEPAAGDDPYRQHPETGYGMLRGNPNVPPTVRHVVLMHHQRFDGSGWPGRGPSTRTGGQRLHVFARIVAAANVLDNLMADADGGQRPAVAALCEFAGPRFEGWFDPIVRAAALRSVPPFAVGDQVELSDGRTGVVVAPNPVQPCRPTVRVLDEAAEAGRTPETIDLGDRPSPGIVACAGAPVQRWLYDVDDARPAAGAARGEAA